MVVLYNVCAHAARALSLTVSELFPAYNAHLFSDSREPRPPARRRRRRGRAWLVANLAPVHGLLLPSLLSKDSAARPEAGPPRAFAGKPKQRELRFSLSHMQSMCSRAPSFDLGQPAQPQRFLYITFADMHIITINYITSMSTSVIRTCVSRLVVARPRVVPKSSPSTSA